MAPYVDVETLLQDWHKRVLGYTNVVTDGEPTNLVNLLRTDPVIVVERFGGGETVTTIDNANINIDTFANSLDGARLHAATIHAAVTTRLVRHVYGGAVVSRVQVIRQPIKYPWDSRHLVHRRSAAYRLTLHQFTGVS